MSKKQYLKNLDDLEPSSCIKPFTLPKDEGNRKAIQRFASYGKNKAEKKIRTNTYRVINDLFRPKSPQGKKDTQAVQNFLRQMAFKKFER